MAGFRLYLGQTPSGGQSVAIGQATETDTAQAIAWAPKQRLAEQVLEADLAQAVARLKTLAAAQAAESDLAQTVAARKALAAGQALEADAAQALVRLKALAIGQGAETDLAQPVAVRKGLVIAQAVETDSAQALVKLKALAIGQAAEADSAQVLGQLKTKALGQTAETDLAQPVNAAGAIVVALGQANEADAAFSITPVASGAAQPSLGGGIIAGRRRRKVRTKIPRTYTDLYVERGILTARRGAPGKRAVAMGAWREEPPAAQALQARGVWFAAIEAHDEPELQVAGAARAKRGVPSRAVLERFLREAA